MKQLKLTVLNTIYYTLFRNFDENVYWVDSQNNYIGYNPNYCQFINVALSDLPSEGPVDTILKLNDIQTKEIKTVANNKETYEKTYVFKNGRIHKFKVKKIICFGTTVHIESEIQDQLNEMTFLKKQYADLVKSKEKTEAYLNNLIQLAVPASIYWKDTNSVILGSNLAHTKLAGFINPKEVIGKTDHDFVWHDQAEKIIENDQQIMSSKKGQNIEETATLADHTIHTFLSSKEPLYDKDHNIIGIIGVSLDITELKETQRALTKSKEAAEAGERAKTEFIANISHDIRTPLAGVVGLGGILEKTLQNPENKHMAHDLVQSAHQLLNMLNEILDVISADNISTKDVHEEPFDLKLLIQNIVDLERSSVDFKKIRFLTDVDETIPHILVGDHKKIHHILLNLIGNSIKFTSEGHVAIHIKILEKHVDKIQLQFKITDTGKGIPQEALDKIFDAFYRVTPSYKGLDKGHGLGLHIAQSYTRLLGGDIAVESAVNEGSQFSFSLCFKIADKDAIPKNLPRESFTLSLEKDDGYKDRSTPDNAPLLNAPNILIIEDNHVARTVVKTLFKDAKCNPVTASDGQSGLKLAKTGEFDLIISDVGLPDISGLEITRQLRVYEKEQGKLPIPIVGLTAHAGEKTHIECLEAGMNDVVIKPIKTEMIQEICNKFSLFEKSPNPLRTVVDSVKMPPLAVSDPAHPPALGEDLPGTNAELFEIEHLLLFDLEKARKILGNNSTLLMDMLKTTIHSLIPEELALMKQAHEAGNWQTVSRVAHKLKGGFLSIGLTRAAVACQYLERYYKAGHSELLEKLYDQMLQTLAVTTNSIQSFIK